MHHCKIPQVKLLFSLLSIAIYKVVSKSNSHHLRKITMQINYLSPKKTSLFLYKEKLSIPSIPTLLSLTIQFPQATPHCLLTYPHHPIHRISTIPKTEGKIFTLYCPKRVIMIKMGYEAMNNCCYFYKDNYLVAGKQKRMFKTVQESHEGDFNDN